MNTMTVAGDPVEAVSLSARIADELEREILEGGRSLGARLDERELADHFGASRTPVREALRLLEGNGLIEINGRYGAHVRRLTLPQLLDAFVVVSELEALAAGQAAKRADAAAGDELRRHEACCAAAFRRRDVDGFCAANDALHDAILSASGNWMLQTQLRGVRILNPYRRHVTHQPGRMEASLTEHAAIVDAIRAGDGTAATATMRTHVNALAYGLADFLYFLDASGRSEIIG